MNVTAIEISRRPISPETIYVIFDNKEDASKFIKDVEADFEFNVDKAYEADEKKFAYPFDAYRTVYANVTLKYIKMKEFGIGSLP